MISLQAEKERREAAIDAASAPPADPSFHDFVWTAVDLLKRRFDGCAPEDLVTQAVLALGYPAAWVKDRDRCVFVDPAGTLHLIRADSLVNFLVQSHRKMGYGMGWQYVGRLSTNV